MKIQGRYRKIDTAHKAVCECLKEYYSVVNFNRNKKRYLEACNMALERLQKDGVYRTDGAQWGGKWGNFYRTVALNAEGRYQFVAGFNTNKLLGI